MRKDLKPILWFGNSRQVVRGFGKAVKDQLGDELYRLQIGLDPKNWKPMSTIGPGVREIRVSSGGQFRVVYLLRRPEGIVILHAFQKKSQQTGRADIEISRQRLKQL